MRVILGQDGEPWFVAKDVCEILEISNPRMAFGRLDEDERDDVSIADAIGRLQRTAIINESGLYSLVLHSRKPEAKVFKKWVTSEVLPSIRKTGGYQLPTAPAQPALPQTFAQALRLAAEQAEVIDLQAKQIEAAKPAVAFTGAVSDMTDCIKVGAFAKIAGHGQNRMFARLDDDERDGVQIADAVGRQQEMTIINESGLYSLILTSHKPQAKAFKKWGSSEVLPSNRKIREPREDWKTPSQLALNGQHHGSSITSPTPKMIHIKFTSAPHLLVDEATAAEARRAYISAMRDRSITTSTQRVTALLIAVLSELGPVAFLEQAVHRSLASGVSVPQELRSIELEILQSAADAKGELHSYDERCEARRAEVQPVLVAAMAELFTLGDEATALGARIAGFDRSREETRSRYEEAGLSPEKISAIGLEPTHEDLAAWKLQLLKNRKREDQLNAFIKSAPEFDMSILAADPAAEA